MSRPVLVVDYGLGNLFSVSRALAAAGGLPRVSSDADEIRAAERLVLPGVGAFGDGMGGLRERGLVEPLREYAKAGRPLLGLCLGLQLFLERGTEFGEHEGLGLIPGAVEKVEAPAKLPHIGWNALEGRWDGSILAGLPQGAQVYFVHSYAPVPARAADSLATCDYAGTRIHVALRKDNVTGCQFHPEKSGPVGLRILSRFLEDA